MEHTITALHVIGAALWLGGLATLLANQRNANPTIVKRTALVSITGLLLLATTGLAAATKYGDPTTWMKMGTTVGKIGEKITALTTSTILAATALHHLAKGKKTLLTTTALTLSIIITIGATILGTSLARGI